ncbi:MAG: hypothetical protein DI624_03070 [Brevundimonas sp.]|uniref:hypothetical protein n=1 Tax=Brevundimonas sp. TaxID=1871086 RepID=UPI000DB30BFB|nr:hypothetical protein [Brevundimonas sp.]PZU00340.1 MAG: hypothetical protein DI624_03070 [Brevundimonas sp.]
MGLEIQGYRARDRDRAAAGLPHGRAEMEERLRRASLVVRTIVMDTQAQQRLIAHAAEKAGLARSSDREQRHGRQRDR